MVDAPIDGPASAPKSTPLERAESGRRQVAILTPEGVELRVEIAERGERAGAFMIDALFVTGAVVALGIAIFYTMSGAGGYAFALWWTLFFLLRVFYFSFFELAWRGRTPGKRLLGMRVIDRAGGPLKPSSVVVRNLVRELEVFLPLMLLAMPGGYGEDAIIRLLLIVWVGIFMLMPLFNRHGLRVGDMVAGTLVVAAPKAALLPDLGSSVASTAGEAPTLQTAPPASRFTFTARQLEFYGIYELQTLEAVLRRTDPHAAATRREIAQRIRKKIGWEGEERDIRHDGLVTEFLQDFYVAQRARLEHRMLFGKRRKDKHDKA